MTLRQKQSVFAFLVAHLILEAKVRGFEVTFGEAYRSPEEAARLAAAAKKKGGRAIANSLHTIKLAIDLNLFRDGKYLSSTESHRPLGEWWEKQGAKHGVVTTWGGHFGDGNHYSVTHGGVK